MRCYKARTCPLTSGDKNCIYTFILSFGTLQAQTKGAYVQSFSFHNTSTGLKF